MGVRNRNPAGEVPRKSPSASAEEDLDKEVDGEATEK